MPAPVPSKPCLRCGREMTWRKKWAKTWGEVKYCSDACRRAKPGATDVALEAAIVELLGRRAGDATICPSEAARAVDPDAWATLMELARRAGRRLANAGVIDVTQGGRAVDPSNARGPIRYRRGRRWGGRANAFSTGPATANKTAANSAANSPAKRVKSRSSETG